jgi:hypothetical protein
MQQCANVMPSQCLEIISTPFGYHVSAARTRAEANYLLPGRIIRRAERRPRHFCKLYGENDRGNKNTNQLAAQIIDQ